MSYFRRKFRAQAYRHILSIDELESRRLLAAPEPPVIIEPLTEGDVTGTFDLNMQTDPALYFDADGDEWEATDWRIREAVSQTVVWQAPFTSSPPLTLYRVDFSDGQFVGPLSGRTELNYSTQYQLVVRYRDSNQEVSDSAVRGFRTAGPTEPVPGAGQWLVRPGYTLDVVQTGLRLPVNVAFVPNPGPNPQDPLYFVNELYGSIRVIRNDGTMSVFASGLLDYNPQGPISGSGEQGLTGLAVERDPQNSDIYHLYAAMLWDNGAPPGGPNHYPKVERITSQAGGLEMASRTVLLNMQPETQGQSHQISTITIGPDDKLYVHMGDGFNASTALNLDQYRGKVLRMNKDGSPVAPNDPAGGNPFYDLSNGINSRDYIFTYGHRNPFGGAWEPATDRLWTVENGNGLDRMVDLISGGNYLWNGNDSSLIAAAKYIWNPATAPVNMAFVGSTIQGGSMFPASTYGHAYVTLSGSTYAAGPLQRSKGIVEFPDLAALGTDGYLAEQPSFLVKYNGTGRATVAALAAGPEGLYFSDLYEDTGVNGPTAAGANLYRIRYVGDAGGESPTIVVPASATPNPVILGSTAELYALADDDGGEEALNYHWGLLGNPPAAVNFSVNGSNIAKNTIATFTANGTYNFFVAARDVSGQSAISAVSVEVRSILTDIGDGITAQYFDNIDLTALFATRVDPVIDFNWGTEAPIPGMGSNTFSIRWTGFILPRYTETYTFITTTDDGVRLWVNNQSVPIIDRWFDQSATSWTGTISLNAGQWYPIRMEYYENGGNAVARLEWQSPTQTREVVPQGRLFTLLPFAPAAPSNLMLTSPWPNQVNLTWTDNASNESGFKIFRSTDGLDFTLIATVSANVTTFEDRSVQPETPYWYRVRATNHIADSSFTDGSISTGILGDFNADLSLNIEDIDLLIAAIVSATNPIAFDLNHDGLVNLNDRDKWLALAGARNLPSQNAYLLADVNLDGVVDGADFLVWNTHKFTNQATWSVGDFNADGAVDGNDFLIWNANKFTSANSRNLVNATGNSWTENVWMNAPATPRSSNNPATERLAIESAFAQLAFDPHQLDGMRHPEFGKHRTSSGKAGAGSHYLPFGDILIHDSFSRLS